MPLPCSRSLNSVTIESSAIAQLDYDSERESLQVWFRDGRAYRYDDVPQGLYQGLLCADSTGAYFNRRIRNHFRCQIMQRPR